MKQSEIWLINLDPTIGSEIQKTRPALIVNDDALGKLPLRIIVPLTDWKDRYEVAPWMIKIVPDAHNQLTKNFSADCFQIRSVSEQRFVKKVGFVSETVMEAVRLGLSKVLTIPIES